MCSSPFFKKWQHVRPGSQSWYHKRNSPISGGKLHSIKWILKTDWDGNGERRSRTSASSATNRHPWRGFCLVVHTLVVKNTNNVFFKHTHKHMHTRTSSPWATLLLRKKTAPEPVKRLTLHVTVVPEDVVIKQCFFFNEQSLTLCVFTPKPPLFPTKALSREQFWEQPSNIGNLNAK